MLDIWTDANVASVLHDGGDALRPYFALTVFFIVFPYFLMAILVTMYIRRSYGACGRAPCRRRCARTRAGGRRCTPRPRRPLLPLLIKHRCCS